MSDWLQLPPGYSFISHDRIKSPLYFTDRPDRAPKFAGYWWHDEPIEKAIKRGYKPEKPWL